MTPRVLLGWLAVSGWVVAASIVGSAPAFAAAAPTATKLTVLEGNSPLPEGAAATHGRVLTLVATVTSGATHLTIGRVNFCDAASPHCTDIHLLGTAQLTGDGKATLKFVPGIGKHTYKAVFAGTPNGATAYAGSVSANFTVPVDGRFPTATTITGTGAPGNYEVTATVTGSTNDASSRAPHGTVDFLELSRDNRLLGSAVLTGSTVAPAYINLRNPATGKHPDSIAIGDFNGDGFPDLAVANGGASTVTILPGKGDGTFAPGTTITVNDGLLANAVVTGDFNGDGKADLAVLSECGTPCSSAGSLAILLGNGDGGFTRSDTISVPQDQPSNPLAVADFNGDGIADIAVASADTDAVIILIGKGDGTFSEASGGPARTASGPCALAVGDLNGDGIPDIAVASYTADGEVTVLLGNGDGTFTTAAGSPVAVGYDPSWIAFGDFDGDGKLDMAVVNAGTDSAISYTRGTLEILLGNGNGTFRKAPKSPATFLDTEWSVAVADFNGDGIPDLGVAGLNAGYTLTLLSGNGDGTFANEGHPLALGASNTGIGVADFNGDGISDFAVTNNRNNTVGILLAGFAATSTGTALAISPEGFNRQQVAGRYVATSAYETSTSASVTLSAPPAQSATELTVSSGGKTIASGSSIPWGSALELTAKVVAQGKTQTAGLVAFCDAPATTCSDIHLLGEAAITKAGTATLHFHPGIGSHQYNAIFNGTPNGQSQDKGSASNTVKVTVTGHYPTQTSIAQTGNAQSYTLTATVSGLVNAPGLPFPAGTVSFLDTTANNKTVATAELRAGTQALTFLESQTPSAGSFPYAVASGDFNGDGIPDLAVGNDDIEGPISILLGNGDGTFRQARGSPFKAPGEVTSLVAGDFNGDGIPDLAAITGSDNGVVFVMIGKGDGTFELLKDATIPVGGQFNNLSSLAVGDLNGDGKEDLIVLATTEYPGMPCGVYVLLGDGTGHFVYSGDSPIGVSPYPFAAAIADLNGDGIPDLAVVNWSRNSVTILLGIGDGTFSAARPPAIAVGVKPDAIVAGDFNGDGKIDLAVANSDPGKRGSVTVLLGNGDGTFKQAPHSPIPAGASSVAIVASDFNLDGKTDLAVANGDGDSVTVLIGDGDGAFTQAAASPLLGAGQFPQSMVSADFNGDGIPDLAVASWGDGPVYVYMTQPMQTMTATATGVPRPDSGKHLVKASFAAEGIFSGSTSATTPLFAAQITPTLQIVAYSTITTLQSADVFVIVTGGAGNPTPSGSVTLTDGTYSSGAHKVVGSSPPSDTGSVRITIPAGALPVGTGTLTATYTPDSPGSGAYGKASASQSLTVITSP